MESIDGDGYSEEEKKFKINVCIRQVLEDDREKRQTMVSPSNTRVHIDVVDINDNPPHFEKDTFYAGTSTFIS